MDNKIIQVALDGLENILRVGEADRGDPPQPGSINKYALFIEEANGMEKIHDCQQNANQDIYKKAYHIIDTYDIPLQGSLNIVTLEKKKTSLIPLSLRDKKPVNSPLEATWDLKGVNSSALEKMSICHDRTLVVRCCRLFSMPSVTKKLSPFYTLHHPTNEFWANV